jgi:hypothetical protein
MNAHMPSLELPNCNTTEHITLSEFPNYNTIAKTPSLELPNYKTIARMPSPELPTCNATTHTPSPEFSDYSIASANGSRKCKQLLSTQKCKESRFLKISSSLSSLNFININSNSITQNNICRMFGNSCV